MPHIDITVETNPIDVFINSDPTVYVTTNTVGIQGASPSTGDFITRAESGLFYPSSNPSGFVTGMDVNNLVTKDETGIFATSSQLSGYVLVDQTGVFATTSQLAGYVSTGQTGNFLTTSQTGNFITSSQTGVFATTSQLSIYITTGQTGDFAPHHLGNPTDGTYGGPNGAIAGIAAGDTQEDAFDKVEFILGKLAPAKPQNLSAATFAFVQATYSALEQGTATTRTNVLNTRVPSGRATGFYDGDLGILSGMVNDTVTGSRTLSTGSDVGTYTGLKITADTDPYAGQAGKAGFWTYLSADVGPTASLNTGTFYLQMGHSTAGSTPRLSGYVDAPATPTVYSTSATTGACVTRTIDGVPSLATNDPINVNFSLSGAVTSFYRSTIATISSSETSTINISTTGTPLSGTNLNLSGTTTVSTNKYKLNWTGAIQGFNSIGTAGSSSAGTNIRIDTVSAQPASRVSAGIGQYPVLGAFGGIYNNSTFLISNEELQLINGSLQIPPSVNYSGYIPSGPNYTNIQTGTYNAYRWSCFNLGAINNVTNFTFAINGSANFGASAVVSNVALYVLVSGTSPTNGWIDANTAYPGVGNPTNNGEAALDLANSTATSKRVTFGSAAKLGTIFVRIGLPSGSNKTFTSIS